MRALEVAASLTTPTGFTLQVDVSVGAGETVAVIGPNGAGKSTLVMLVAGHLEPGDSTVVLDGVDITEESPAGRRLGVVFQDGLLFPNMTVAENIGFGAKGDPSDVVMAMGVGDLLARYPDALSGGEAQLVAVARALAMRPAALVLDEPTSALDASVRPRVRSLLSQLSNVFMGPTLIVTHDPVDAFLLADRVVVIEDGRVVQSGVTDDLRIKPKTRYVADMIGTNRMAGVCAGDRVDVEGFTLTVPGDVPTGSVQVNIHPTAVNLSLERPKGSSRNVWKTHIDRVEDSGSRVRVGLAAPFPLTAEITPGARSEMALEPGRSVWASVKATEIGVTAAE